MSGARDWQLVDDAQGLRACVDECLRHPCVGIDTEFEWRKTFFPKPALIQLSVGERHWLVYPEAVEEDKASLVELLRADNIKIMHACREDTLVLGLLTGFFVERVFDMQIANGLLGWQPQLSYHNLVRARLGDITATGETMSDWLRRPLSEAQLRYAIDDVRWLPKLYRLVHRELEERGRLEWLWEDVGYLCREAREKYMDIDGAELAGRIKGYGRMSRSTRHALQALCEWRDAEARKKDRPRRWILEDEALAAIAAAHPESPEELERTAGVGKKTRKYARKLLKCLERAEETAHGPEAPRLPRNQEEIRRFYEELRRRAVTLDLDPTVVTSRADCPELIEMLRRGTSIRKSKPKLQSWQGGWRSALLEGMEEFFDAESAAPAFDRGYDGDERGAAAASDARSGRRRRGRARRGPNGLSTDS